MVEDRSAARGFLDGVQNIKHERRRRNLQEMMGSPEKEEVDFIRHNIDDFYSREQKAGEKQLALQIKKER